MNNTPTKLHYKLKESLQQQNDNKDKCWDRTICMCNNITNEQYKLES